MLISDRVARRMFQSLALGKQNRCRAGESATIISSRLIRWAPDCVRLTDADSASVERILDDSHVIQAVLS